MIRTLLACSALLLAGSAFAEDAKPAATPTPYPLTTCPVSGEELGEMGAPVVKVYEGREVKFCCNKCVAKFEKDPATYLKAIDEKAKAAAADKGAKPAEHH